MKYQNFRYALKKKKKNVYFPSVPGCDIGLESGSILITKHLNYKDWKSFIGNEYAN